MKVRIPKPNEVMPIPIGLNESYVRKLPGFQEFKKKILEGTIANSQILELDEADAKAAGGRDLSKIAGKVAERLKKELLRCYRQGAIEGRNVQIYQAGTQVIIIKVGDKEVKGFLHTPRGQAAFKESRAGKAA